MTTTHQYKKLKVWNDSVVFSVDIYKITKYFPEDEKFGLISQLRRASVSVPSNIAEGSKRGTKKDFAGFLRIAHGSCAEIETQLLISKELGYIHNEAYSVLNEKLDSISGMLASFIKTLSD